MNISKAQIDDLNAVIEIEIEPSDYTPKVDASLIEYRKKVKMDGFRPGKVPAGLVKKMYGKAILMDEVQKLLSETLNNFITENKIKILGEPLPNEESPKIDWENADAGFMFRFDIGIAPEPELTLSKKDKIPAYKITITDEMINNQIDSYTRRFGSYHDVDQVNEGALVKADVVQVDADGNPLENGIRSDLVTISLKSITNEEVTNKLLGLKKEDELLMSPEQLFENEADRAAALGIKREELDSLQGAILKITLKEISSFKSAEINQELFNQVFGDDAVDSEESFRAKVADNLSKQFEGDIRFKQQLDVRDKLLAKTDVQLPDAFLRRWMLLTQDENPITEEQLEAEYPKFSGDLKWQLIKNKIIAENKLEATEDEMKSEAISRAYMQYRQYGLYEVPDEHLIRLAEHIMKNEDEQRTMIERILERKVVDIVLPQIKLEEKEISYEVFVKLFE